MNLRRGTPCQSPPTAMKHKEQEYAMAFQAGYRRTFLTLLRRSRRHDLAEELAQAAWLRAWERWDQCQSPNPVPWVIGIARHMLCDEIRRSSRFCRLGPEHDRPTLMAIDVRAIDLDRILNKSAKRQWQLLRTVYIEERPMAKIAEELGISRPAVHKRVSRALRAIQGLMNAA